ncbi:MAG: M23 family metallopeptidase [Acidobacteriota bacterium]|nr:M23 family metallopeptidase [Acidobacteriota bacterium]MDH3522229.1 M23 family metallopeptidase [Acidobacteriota bacterium]
MANSARKPAEGTVLEIQIHPSDIRRRVWYFFLTRRQIRWAAAVAAAVVLFLGLNAVLAPQVVGNLLSRSRYESLVAERARHGERLQDLTAQMAALDGASEELHLKMNRIYTTYGLRNDETSAGQGYPIAPRSVPESIYAGAIRRGSTLEAKISEQLRVLGSFIDEIQSFESAHGDQVLTTPSVSPLNRDEFVLTSPFGNRRSPFTKERDFHPGLDLAASTGTEIHAPAAGVVVFAGRYPLRQSVSWWRYGNLVALRNGERFITLFGHCEEVLVKSGQRVAQGDVIATVGNTGWSTNPHLHYEVRVLGEDGEFTPVDPRIYILDHRWRDEEQLLVRARMAPDLRDYEPLPRLIGR